MQKTNVWLSYNRLSAGSKWSLYHLMSLTNGDVTRCGKDIIGKRVMATQMPGRYVCQQCEGKK